MLVIIIPAFNEATQIGRVISGLFEIEDRLKQINDGFKLIVIDDGSSDRTAEIARALRVVVLRHEVNRGQGAALETGNEYARRHGADVVVHFDADGQHNPTDITSAVERLRNEKLDVILGSRFLDSRSKIPWFKRYIILPASCWINFVFTGVKLSDAHNGFRVLNRKALEQITISHDGMAHNSEIVQQIKARQLRFVEHPVQVNYHRYGQGISSGFKILSDFLFGQFVK